MKNRGLKKAFRLATIAGVLAGMLTIVGCPGGGGGGAEAPPPVPVAAINTVVPVTAATVQAIENLPFALPAGAFADVPALANQATTVRITGTTTATPTGTITAANGTATGTTTFGSCTFTITSVTGIPGLLVGQQITVQTCQYIVSTGGVQATGNATTVQILLQLGLTPSQPNQASVSIDPATGIVTVNNTSTGVSVTLVVSTGATGG